MFEIRLAKRTDLPAIQLLTSHYNMPICEKYLNHRDISVVAYDGGKLVGFLWVGLMAGNTVGYIDRFVVRPEYAKRGVGHRLARFAFTQAKKRGMRECFGVIRHGKCHENSAMNALKMAFSAHKEPYTYVCAQLKHMAAEIPDLEDTHGR